MSDYSDQEDPDDFVFFGHSLDPLEEDEVPSKKPIRIEDQIVTDENGRRRFHGAFTGGFSAGYYNTVGSKEGWRPSTFKSSRSERAQIKHSVQDYMDEEDMGAFGFAPQVLRAKDDFGTTSTSRKRARPVYPSEGPIPGLPVLHDLLRPVKESIGLRLLKAMGWKPGQGVGERITRKEKKQRKKRNDPSRVYGCPLPPKKQVASDESEEESEDEVHLFAPDDIPSFLVKPKENTFGLGYSGLIPRDAAAGKSSGFSLFEPTLSITDKNRKVRIAGQAFGVGAFEDDDEDIYSRDDMSQYDFVLGGEKPKEKSGKKMLALPSTDTLDGFVKAAKPEPVPKIFPPPNLPRDFVPVHRTRKSRFDVQPAEESALRGLGRHQLDSAQRAAILEDIKPSPAASRAVVPATPLPQTVSVPKPTERPAPHTEPQPKEKPRLSSNDSEWKKKREEILQFLAKQKPLDKSVLFQPFVRDSEKQKRFESYMVLSKTSKTDDFRYLQPESMTEWEREREENEFERAFALYRPLSGQMQNRFASGGHFEESIQGGLGTFVPPTETESKVKSVETEKDPARRAAKMKMFGKLTRQKIEWRPDRLLCVRFNVPNPFPSSGAQPSKPVPKRGPREFSIFDVLSKEPEEPAVSKISDLDVSQTKNVAEVKSLEWEKAEKGETVDQAEPETVAGPLEEHKNAEEEEIVVQRPPMDFFKAIFESEDEEESMEEQRNEEKKNAEQREEGKPATAVSVSETSDSSEEEEDGRDSDSFGPRLPAGKPVVLSSGSVTNVPIQRNVTNDDAEWVEKREDGEKKKKKKKEKKEHKKSKSKKKHREDREKSKKHKHKSKSPDLDSKLVKKLAKLSKSK